MKTITFALLAALQLSLISCTEDAKPAPEVIRTNYEIIMSDYKSNGLVADEKYKDKLVNIPGRLESVSQGIGGFTVMAKTRDDSVLAVFDLDAEADLKKLKEGDRFRMTCAVSLNGTIFQDCMVAK